MTAMNAQICMSEMAPVIMGAPREEQRVHEVWKPVLVPEALQLVGARSTRQGLGQHG